MFKNTGEGPGFLNMLVLGEALSCWAVAKAAGEGRAQGQRG